ncbi:hypothetical protein [Pelagibacterium luteolum]|uniref:Uncharacterized protein n=1 Tax=Pelagibacterium luteolum TaxID=440168 RepID=A0A1G7ZUH6_9HYPH|nr:hypothetical protein [Pelagibacterium luteolum]SDH11810.1 hypothetical protein SAMN04487974_12243 [Pelagibacterium luteolum]
MAEQSPQRWAETFASDLVLDGERIPFDRVVQRHYAALVHQRATGLTWKALANLLRRAGAVRESGKAYTGDHLRVAFGRIDRAERNLTSKATGGYAKPTSPMRPTEKVGRSEPLSSTSTRQKISGSTLPPSEKPLAVGGEKDVSEAEIGLALDRITKLKR